jgi:hypothetical protein
MTTNASPNFTGITTTDGEDSVDNHSVLQTRAVPLGSRKNLCINDDLVASLRHDKQRLREKDKENQPLAAGKAWVKDSRDNSGRHVGDLDEACRELNNRGFASC